MSDTARILPFPTAPLRLVVLRTFARRPLFGVMREGRLHPSRLGALARQMWLNLPIEYPGIGFEWFQVQPTAVVALVRAPRSAERDRLRGIVAHYKAMVTGSGGAAGRVWDPGYEAVPVTSSLARSRRAASFAATTPCPALRFPQGRPAPGVMEK